jgi:hypothetical protein
LSPVALRRWSTTRSLAAAAAVAVLAGVTVLLLVTGRGAVSVVPTAARVARTAALLAAPAAALAWWAPRLPRLARGLLALLAAGAVAGTAAWTWADDGVVLVPAALLLAAAALPCRATPSGDMPAGSGGGWRAALGAPAHPGLVLAAGVATVVGVLARAATLDDVTGLLSSLNVAVAGLVLLGWPIAAVALVPAPPRSRTLAAAAAVATAAVLLRAPAGGEAWLAPAVVLLLAAAVVPAGTAATTPAARPATPTRRFTATQRAVGGTAVAVLVGLGVLVSPELASGSGSLRLASGPVRDGQQAIGVADAHFLVDATASAELVPGARCYFVPQGGDVYADQVACGPVTHSTDDPAGNSDTDGTGSTDPTGGEPAEEPEPVPTDPGAGGTWDVYPVQAQVGQLQVTGEPAVGQQVDVTSLYRPDGLQPPGGENGTTVTPTTDRGFAVRLDEDPGDVEAVDGSVLAGRTEVGVDGVAWPATVPDDSGQDVRAPAGFRFVAVNLGFQTDQGSPAGTSLEIVVGDHRLDVTDVVSGDGSFYQDGWVAAVTPAGEDAPTLDVTYRGHTERLDLGSGERVDPPPLLYEPRSQDLNQEVAEAQVPVTIPVPAPHAAAVQVDGYTITRADLTAFEENRGWAPDGQAWLVITVDSLYNPYLTDTTAAGGEEYFRFVPRSSFSLQPDGGGDPVAPENAGPSADGAGVAVVFAVPDDLGAATLQAAPRWILSVGGQDVEVTAPATDVALDL